MEHIILVSDENGIRLDSFVSNSIDGVSRSYAATLADDGRITSSGKILKKNYKVSINEVIEVDIPEPETLEVVPENIPIDIIYEDNDLIVVNKPQGMVVHPAAGNYSGTLVNALLYHCGDSLSAINGVIRPGIVHRIDKDTAGLLVVAKNNDAHIALAKQLKEKKANRRYIALVVGNVKEAGTVNKPIARSLNDRKKMAVVSGGREAVTHYTPLENYNGYTLLECVLETGRTHQIRVHMSSIGHPIAGDPVYGARNDKTRSDGQLLLAKTLGFNHPATGEYMEFSAPIPDWFEEILNKHRKNI
ncbi:MAG: RluA family pseudouridine synthase [Eubacteriales bacterium]|nr:RluA family pseudouridine synthase [Eubacteriales bacterium]